ncbi:MAG: chemoreceptor glutamine deamidase CheD [Sterolibacteriaceae bacterium]|uniref:chemoreceptor glutamine deamidase CheD n=1 Tax=Sulfuritalea sp. TaxID=2480090 RepID=UPI001A40C078|nr:chemoreceptor glutamine deamidase CheD [Sulfuritalea sp.]MBL8478568.1 chemoreceptor glutamine deamidase CheD [Sterolibacteriaceae bacterium]MBN8475623.1 chemoreceptor glutamine deamidase CheD [Sulfuritalea sp.]
MDAGFIEHLAGNRYFDPTFGAEAVKVLPGEYFVTTTDMLLVTVLGSCVSACIRDKAKGIGGMNHFMLADSGEAGPNSSSARYGTYAMEILINHLLKLGARRSNLEAKVFGGGRVMSALASANVGERNCSFVLEFLRTEGIPVSARDLLDIHPRKVYFFPATGRVLVKKLTRLHNDTLLRRESEYAARLTQAPISGDVELF